MKKIFPLLLLLVSTFATAQNVAIEKIHYLKITQEECVKKKGYRLLLKEVISDSRCPEGVTCVWAGEIKVLVALYQNKKLVENDTITVSARHLQENKAWFLKYLPAKKRNIKSIVVLPYPKEGAPKNYADYYLQIGYL